MAEILERLQEAVAAVTSRTALEPKIGVILGSGLGPLADEIRDGAEVPYADIPHMPQSAAPGHANRLVIGHFGSRPVAMLAGRVHLYEGYSPEQVVFGVRLLRLLGVETLILTNAAGAVNAEFKPGQLMLISDQINLTGQNPLVGPNEPELGVRFPDMSEAFDWRLRGLAQIAAKEERLPVVEGVYLGTLGPSYETPSEIRMARSLGADAVGMSTVLEVIAANHAGMRVLGISCLTNMAAGILHQRLTEEEVLETANRVRDEFAALVRGVIEGLDPQTEPAA